MKPEDKVATLEQCKKLVQLGVILNTQYAYVNGFLMLWSGIESCDVDELCLPAPDVAELGMLLPKFIIFEEYRYWLSLDNITTEFGVSYKIDNHLLNSEFLGDKNFYEPLEAQARAEALIWLIDNDFVKPENIKL